MGKIIKLGLTLLLITSIGAGILAYGNSITKDQIEKLRIEEGNKAKQEIFTEGKEFKDMEYTLRDGVLEVQEALSDSGELVGYIVKTASKAYGGDIEVTTGINLEGKVEGIKIGNHSETPGLGSNAEKPEFRDQFKDKDASKPIGVAKASPGENEVQALTGATITTDGVAEAVNLASEVYIEISK